MGMRTGAALFIALFCICFDLRPQAQKTTVTGKLVRQMTIGGESTGWAIEPESEPTIGGKQVNSIEIEFHDVNTLDELVNQRVEAAGTLSHRRGVETGQRPVFEVSSIRELKRQAAEGTGYAFRLAGSEWVLEDLPEAVVLDNVQPTLAFPEAGKVSGKASCNRFFGPAKIEGNVIKVGPLAATRMACPEPVMQQETKYFNALQRAERFEWQDPYLLIYFHGSEKPLRFTRKGDAAAPVKPK